MKIFTYLFGSLFILIIFTGCSKVIDMAYKKATGYKYSRYFTRYIGNVNEVEFQNIKENYLNGIDIAYKVVSKEKYNRYDKAGGVVLVGSSYKTIGENKNYELKKNNLKIHIQTSNKGCDILDYNDFTTLITKNNIRITFPESINIKKDFLFIAISDGNSKITKRLNPEHICGY